MRILDLFSGIGGFSLAGRWAGFETIQFVEKDSFCQKVLRKHWPNVPIHDDIKTFSYTGSEQITLLTGGFPCQGFSVAGKKKGILDERYLWPEMYRVIQECHPNWIIAENVVGIVNMALDSIIDDLGREGYQVQSYIIPACAAEAPHRRDRVWIVANTMRKRCDNGIDYWETRYIQDDKKWDIEALYKEWSQFIPQSWKAFTVKDWFQYNTDINRGSDGLPERLDRLKSLGNAIVPQVVYPIMKLIYEIEKGNIYAK